MGRVAIMKSRSRYRIARYLHAPRVPRCPIFATTGSDGVGVIKSPSENRDDPRFPWFAGFEGLLVCRDLRGRFQALEVTGFENGTF